jgi:hypothetical protein
MLMIAARPRSLHSVDQQDGGILNEGAADADTLALTAGEFISALVGHMGKAHAIQKTKGFVEQKTAPESDIAKAAGQNVFHDGQAFDQRVFLKDHAHAATFAAQRA